MEPTPRILSIQSHVVSGYCGNKSATFPLQLLEFEVDVLNSVQLSNHTQYKVAKGQIYNGQDLEQISLGLKTNQLTKLYDIVLSGYVADPDYIKSMANLIEHIKKERMDSGKRCLYTLDPVLGDDGVGYYVPNSSEIADAYKNYLIPMADIITPNRFEASSLSGVEIDCCSPDEKKALRQAREAIDVFHAMGVQIVIITSFEFKYINSGDQNHLTCIASYSPNKKKPPICKQLSPQIFMIKIPKLDCPFTGTGDLFTALMTAWLNKTEFDLKESLENTATTIHDILVDTLAWSKAVSNGKRDVQSYELRLVQNRDKIIKPNKKFLAENLSLD